MNVSELLFELASDERVAILYEVSSNPSRASEIAHRLSATVQETARQLERLTEAKLISRDDESRYRITTLGRLVLALLPSFKVIQDERDFFLSHDLSWLPPPFLHRLGELAEHRTITKLDEALADAEETIKGAKKYVWLMSDQSIRQSFPHEHPAEVAFRFLLPKDIDSDTTQRLRTRIGPNLDIAKADQIKVSIVMNEKRAALYFPTLDGRMDLARGFASEESAFHRWCEDLYTFYWGEARAGHPQPGEPDPRLRNACHGGPAAVSGQHPRGAHRRR